MTTSAPSSLSLVPSPDPQMPFLRWVSSDAPAVVLGLTPARPLAEPLDGPTLAAVAADLLRPGWKSRARMVGPMLENGCIHRGVSLARETTLAVGATSWILRALTATPIQDSLDWSALARTLDTFGTLAS